MRRVRYRPFQALAVGVLGALVTACVVFAPLYFQAMQQALTTTSLDRAPLIDTSLQVTSSPATFRPARVLRPEAVAAAVESDPAYVGSPVLGYDAGAAVLPLNPRNPVGVVVWRSGQCDRVTFVDGRCPAKPGEIAITAADIANFGYQVGGTVDVAGAPDRTGLGKDAPAQSLEVVGVYEQRSSPLWFDQPLTGRSGLVDPAPPASILHDVWLTDRATFTAKPWRVDVRSSYAGFVLDQDAIDIDALDALGTEADRLHHVVPGEGLDPLRVVSGLPDLADDVQHQVEQSRVTVPLLMAQLCLLALVVLWLVLLTITEQRRPEVALARLRGRGRRGARALLYAELLPVTLLSVVPGAGLALLASWVVGRWVLPGGPPLGLGPAFLGALTIATLLLLGVSALAIRKVAHEPVSRLLRRVPPRSAGWALGATDAILIAGCGGIVVVFAIGGLDGPAALAAPGLLAIVVGLVLAHVTPPTAAVLGRRRLRRGRVRAGVSLLDASRSPATRRIVVVVTLAAALAVFSADALVVGQRNRALASEQEAGAARVVVVQGADLISVRAALDELGPSGSRVTPVVRIQPPGYDAAGTLAVVPSEFRRIALFPGGGPGSALWDRLQVPDVEPVALTGTALRLELTGSTLDSVRADGVHEPVTIGLELVTPTSETLHTTLGAVPSGTERRRITQRVSCAQGCKLTGISFSTLPGAVMSGHVTIGGLTTEPSGAAVEVGPASGWTPYDEAGTKVVPSSDSPDALTVEVESAGTATATLRQGWLPASVPTLASGPVADTSRSGLTITGLDGESQPATLIDMLDRVPASSPPTFVSDLDVLSRGRSVLTSDQVEVWFADDDPALYAQVRDALADRGIEVATSRTLPQVRDRYDDSAAAWSLQLAALVGLLAILIAMLVLVVSAVSAWRPRTRDLAALRMSGVPRRTIGAIAVAAQLPAVVVGVAAGCASGLLGAWLALPIVPLFADAPEVSTLDLATARGAVALAAVVSFVVLGAASVAIGQLLAGRAELRRLRETM